jgi:hypothetical protein
MLHFPSVEGILLRGDLAITGVLRLFALANNFRAGMKLLQREALEAKAVGGASTVKVEAVVCTTLTARNEPYNRKAINAS